MAAGTISYTDKQGGTLIPIVFDLVKEEKHDASSVVTDHPVEKGANVADHKRARPASLILTVMVTNTPIDTPGSHAEGTKGTTGSMAVSYPVRRQLPIGVPVVGALVASAGLLNATETVQAQVLQFSQPFDRVRSVLADLIMIANGGYLVTAETGVMTYEDMTVVSVSVPRSAKDGQAITATIELRGILFADTQTVAVPKDKLGASKKTAGPKPSADVAGSKDGFGWKLLHPNG